MPELPEVEHAARLLRRAVIGLKLTDARLLHPSLRRQLRDAQLRPLVGQRLKDVERVGKYQLLHFADGHVLRVHFRMTGNWLVQAQGEPRARFARAELMFGRRVRVTLDDSRALASLTVHPSRAHGLPALGPDPLSKHCTADVLADALRGRRVAIKVALLDQGVIAGVGNIYAVEALWRARIDPRVPAGALSRVRVHRLRSALVAVLREGLRRAGRYRDGEALDRLAVYGRDGSPCRRCGAPIRRITQSGRSTWMCARCQRARRQVSPAPRSARP